MNSQRWSVRADVQVTVCVEKVIVGFAYVILAIAAVSGLLGPRKWSYFYLCV